MRRVIRFRELGRADTGVVGGKNASLGELLTALGPLGVRVPDGFATTADAYRELLATDGLGGTIARQVDRLHRGAPLTEVGAAIRAAILAVPLPRGTADGITEAYHRLAREADTRTKVMLNLADPGAAFRWWRLPADGVGLARTEFVVAHQVRVHPMALVHPERLSPEDRRRIDELTYDHPDRTEYFVDRLAHGVARIAASRWPDPVVVRTSDFKTNEYARLIGGAPFEPDEANPMIGWRGASRYYDPGYREGFALECRALRRARDELGLTNVVVMIPFCRTPEEADRVLAVMADNGLARGANGLRVYVMAEIPANVILAEQFAERFDGFSIGSNDLTQLTLGVDRDSGLLAHLFDERDPAVTRSVESLITTAHAAGRHVGLCGQRPSNDPEFTRFLVSAGIDSISVTPDSFAAVKHAVAAAERET
ncbi:putative PEP-binding protein [Kitasatospora sp. NPDC004723]|uniref:putative PEP-binding protein n=1 Tax=Kitasatospora sp. NPDC004723 TaxID=3154288 RepID=UPI0033A5801B